MYSYIKQHQRRENETEQIAKDDHSDFFRPVLKSLLYLVCLWVVVPNTFSTLSIFCYIFSIAVIFFCVFFFMSIIQFSWGLVSYYPKLTKTQCILLMRDVSIRCWMIMKMSSELWQTNTSFMCHKLSKWVADKLFTLILYLAATRLVVKEVFIAKLSE